MILLCAYGFALQCKRCKKVYGEYSCAVYKLTSWSRSVCPNCGEISELEEIAESIRDANKEKPSREKSIALTKIEEAIMWLEKENDEF